MALGSRKAFVFTGMSFLLVIPSILLAASFVGMIRYGEAGRELAMESDVVYYISKDMRETIVEIIRKSGRWEVHQASKLVMDTYVNLTRTRDISYAKANSFFPNTEVDPQGRNVTAYLKDQIIETVNLRMNDTVEELERRSGKEIIFNDGKEITNEVTINQSGPWGFYISVVDMPLLVSGGGGPIFNTTLPASEVYITFEGLEDPYIFVQSEANAFSRIYRSPYEPYNTSYDVNVSIAGRIDNLYNVLIGSGTEDNPLPYYHYFGDPTRDDGISFFSRLEGNSTNRPYKIETFLIGNVLGNQSTATRVDHGYFKNTGGDTIIVCEPTTFKDPVGNIFYIDDAHLSYYGLQRSYLCGYAELAIYQEDIVFNSTIQKTGDTVTITATVNNEGDLGATDIKVQFFNGDPDSGGTEIGNQTITLITAGGSDTASVTWTPTTGGINNIYVKVDPDNAIAELNENDNEAFNFICVSSGLTVSIQTPQEGFSKDSCTGTSVDITASVQDSCGNSLVGSNASVAATINLGSPISLTDPDEDGTYYGNWSPSIAGNTDVNVTAQGSVGSSWEGLSGSDNISGYVDNCVGCPGTRLFYDGFNDSSLNSTAWATYQGSWSETSGILKQTSTSNKNPKKAIIKDQSYPEYITLIAKVRVDSWTGGDDNCRAGVGLRTRTNVGTKREGYNLLFHENTSTLQFLNDLSTWGPSVTFNWNTTTWYWFKFKVENTGSATHLYGKVWQDGTSEPNSWNIDSVWNGGFSRDPPTYVYPSLHGGFGCGTTVSFDDAQVCGAS